MLPIDRIRRDFKGQKVLIFGLGILGGGVAVTRFLRELGSKIRVTDRQTASILKPSLDQLAGYPDINYTFGEPLKSDFEWADIIVRNPSVPWHHPLLDYARTLNKNIVMESQLFVQYAGIQTIGVTGTRGKTTTTMMLYDIMHKLSSKQVILGGNLVRQPVLPQLTQIFDPAKTLAILELSSWQLQTFASHSLSVNYALLTNLFPDHLNYYPSLQTYYQDKMAIFSHQSTRDVVCFNRHQPEFETWAKSARGQVIWFDIDDLPGETDLQIPGKHNRENAAAALVLAEKFNFPRDQILNVLTAFKGVPYRLQTIKVIKGIEVINDTTSTTPVATLAALACVKKPVALILGGFSAQLPVNELARVINHEVRGVFLLSGKGTEEIKPYLNPNLIRLETTDLSTAVNGALKEPGIKTLLFSPGFKSFGLFKNEFDRGEKFNSIVDLW